MDVLEFLKTWLPLLVTIIGLPSLIISKFIEMKKFGKNRKTKFLQPVVDQITELSNHLEKSIESLHQRMDKSEEDNNMMKRGLQAELRSRLRMCAVKYIDRGQITVMEKAEFETIYKSYHELGSNGIMDGYYSEVMKLPVVIDKQ